MNLFEAVKTFCEKNWWILDENKNPVRVDALEARVWASQGFETTKRVARTVINRRKRIAVSTVFLQLDHAFFGGPPLLFETMIFGGGMDLYQTRYSTWREAERGHAIAVGYARNSRQTKTRKVK